MRVTLLGCGPSTGVPMVGGVWGACDPDNPKNRRTRSGLLIERDGKVLLIDTGPDLRQQLLAASVKKIDAVIFTHDHADHTHGIDDLRGFSLATKVPIPIYGPAATLETIRTRFAYMFGGGLREGYYDKPFLDPQALEPGDALPSFGIETFAQDHVVCATLGLRCGKFGYSTDLATLSEEGFEKLAGIDTWIVAALRREAHVAHAPLVTVLEWVARIRPRRTILTHMNATMDYETLRQELPSGIEPGYDGLVFDAAD